MFSKKSVIISIKLRMLEEDVVVDNEVDESVFGGGEFVIGGGELNKVSGFGFVDPTFAPLLERLESV